MKTFLVNCPPPPNNTTDLKSPTNVTHGTEKKARKKVPIVVVTENVKFMHYTRATDWQETNYGQLLKELYRGSAHC